MKTAKPNAGICGEAILKTVTNGFIKRLPYAGVPLDALECLPG